MPKDPAQIAQSIQLLSEMVSLFPDCLAEESKLQIASCVHYSNLAVREAASNFLLTVCGDFDDKGQLLEI